MVLNATSTYYEAVAVNDIGEIWYCTDVTDAAVASADVWANVVSPPAIGNLNAIAVVYDGTALAVKGVVVSWDGRIIYSADISGGVWTETVTTPIAAGPLNDVSLVLDATLVKGIAVGGGGEIYYTVDGGVTWAAPTTTNDALTAGTDLFGVSVAEDGAAGLNGVAVGAGGKIYTSTDLLANWTAVTTTATGSDLLSVTNFGYAVTQFQAVAVGTGGEAVRTPAAEAPATAWVVPTTAPNTTNHLRGVSFSSSLVAVAVGDGDIFYSTTGSGDTWITTLTANFNFVAALNGIDFVSKMQGWAVGADRTIIATNDGGMNWALQGTQVTGNTLNDVAFTDAANGIAVGFDLTNAITLYTNDGSTWNTPTTGAGSADLKAAASWMSSLNGVAVGAGGMVYYTIDGGNNWSAATTGFTGIDDFTDVDAVQDGTPVNVAVAVGTDGTGAFLFVSTDGGNNWTGETLPALGTELTAVSLYFDAGGTNLVIGWAVDNTGKVIKSTDVVTGANWADIAATGIAIDDVFRGLDFLDALNGVVAGEDATAAPVIYRTTGGGAAWTADTDNDPELNVLNDVSLKVGSLWGWAAGVNGVVLNYPTIEVTLTDPAPATRGFTAGLNTIDVPMNVDATTPLDPDGNVISFDVVLNLDSPNGFYLDNIDFSGSAVGAGNFTTVINKTNPSNIPVAAAGATPLTGTGFIGNLQFIPTVRSPGSCNLNIPGMTFNDGVPGAIDFPITAFMDVTTIQTGDANADNSITFEDAVAVLRHRVGLINIGAPNNGYADVSGLMGLTAYDAGLILQVDASIEYLFPIEKQALGLLKGVAPVRNVDAQIVLTPTLGTSSELVLMVSAKETQDVLSMEMDLKYPAEQFEYKDFSILAGDFTAEVNAGNGFLRLAMAGTEPLDDDARLIALRFRAGEETSTENFNVTRFFLNEDAVANITFGEAVGEAANLPREFALRQNYPNPFNPETNIKYELPEQAQVKLEIFNLLGQKVRTLVNEIRHAGYYTVTWDSRNDSGQLVSSGVYLYRINAGNFVSVRKMVILR